MQVSREQTLGGIQEEEKLTLPVSLLPLCGLVVAACVALATNLQSSFPSLHTILDAGVCSISLVLALTLWNQQIHVPDNFRRGLAVTFTVTFLLEFIHFLVETEWTAWLAFLQEAATVWAPATWPPVAYVLPIGIIGSLTLLRPSQHFSAIFAPLVIVIALSLLFLFEMLPRYAEPTFLGMTRPGLGLAPLFWLGTIVCVWPYRQYRMLFAVVIASPFFLIAHSSMLYSRSPYDSLAMIAHVCKFGGYVALLLLWMKMASQDSLGRLHAENKLRELNLALEARVKERTQQLELAYEQDRRLAEILQGMSEACFAIDEQWRFTFVNSRTETLLECSAQSMIGQSIWDVFAHLKGTSIETNYKLVMSQGTPVSFESFSPRAKRWLDIRLFRMRGGLCAFLLDIDARKQMEVSVERREEQLRTLLDFLPVGISVMDADRKIAYNNPALLKIARLTAEELSSGPIQVRQFLDRNGEPLPFDLLPSVRAFREQRAIENVEIGIVTEDGETTWALVSAVPVEFGDWRVINVTTDITQHKAAEEKIRYNEEILSETGRIAKVGGWMFDTQTLKGSWTEEVGRIHDLDPDVEASVQLGLQFYTDASRPLIEAAVKDAMELGKPYDLELEIVSAKGVRKWVRTIGHPLVVAGKVARVRGSFQDITEHKRIANALQLEEARLSGIIGSAMDAIIAIDNKHTITVFNAAAEKMFGITSEEAIGTNLGRLIPARFREAHPAHVHAFAETRVSKRHMGQLGAIFGLRADGTEFPIEASISQIEVNQEKVFTVILRDITEKNQAAEKLKQSEELFSTAFQYSPAAIAISRREDFVCLEVNESFLGLFGCSQEEILGHTFFDAHLLDPSVEQFLRVRLAEAGFIENLEVEARTHSGEQLYLSLSIQTIELRGEKCFIATLMNVTERRTAEKEIQKLNSELEERVAQRTIQLEVANKELEAFSYSVSHDLRSPLRAMNGFSQALIEDYGPILPEGAQKFATTIRAGAERMGTLIDELLAFSRIGRSAMKAETVDMDQLARTAFENLRVERGDRRIEFVCPEIHPCTGDPALLSHVWTNLVSNAVKFTGKVDAARIRITSQLEGMDIHYSVSDNGAGFDMAYADKLFGVFQRLHRADEFEGTGVGLAIVNRIVSRHGGRVWSESKVGEGATFHFTIPRKI